MGTILKNAQGSLHPKLYIGHWFIIFSPTSATRNMSYYIIFINLNKQTKETFSSLMDGKFCQRTD